MSVGQPPNPDDVYQHFLDHRERIGRDPNTIRAERQALDLLEEFVNKKGIQPGDVTRTVASEFIQYLYNQGYAERTVLAHARGVGRFYDYYSNTGYYEANPMELAIQKANLSREKQSRLPEVTVTEMREIIGKISHPLTLVIVLILAKTGMRRGEITNLDLRDVHIDDNRVNDQLPDPRPEIENKPDSLFVPSNVSEGDEYNGETRMAGNKRKRSTTIPIDDELKQVIVYWLAVRPPSRSPARPLLTTPDAQGKYEQFGDRVIDDHVYQRVINVAKKEGLWSSTGQKGDQVSPNMTPHFFRHFFTTHMRDRSSDLLVRFIRGDKGDDIMDEYTHQWGQKVERDYLNNIYKMIE